MKIEKVLISPKLASEMLSKNTQNRNVKKRVVDQYANDIQNDKWMEDTGETIKVAKDGSILDGQHRLLAIIKANKHVYMHVANGLNKGVFAVIDTGKKRSSCDLLHIEGVKNSTALSGIINKFLYIKSGSKDRKFNGTLTGQMTLEEYNSNPKIWEGIGENACRWYIKFNRILAASVLGGRYAYFRQIHEIDAFNFFEQLSTGDDIKNPTINVLRNALIKDKINDERMIELKKSAIIIKAWNCFRKGTTLHNLTYTSADNRLKAE